jgi:hypothetical protein
MTRLKKISLKIINFEYNINIDLLIYIEILYILINEQIK